MYVGCLLEGINKIILSAGESLSMLAHYIAAGDTRKLDVVRL